MMIPKLVSSKRNQFDYDGDGIKNRFDCQPRNLLRQDSRIYLSKNKEYKRVGGYVPRIPYNTRERNAIFIGSKHANEKNPDIWAQTIAHEELHKALRDEVGVEASTSLDNFAGQRRISVFHPKTGKRVDVNEYDLTIDPERHYYGFTEKLKNKDVSFNRSESNELKDNYKTFAEIERKRVRERVKGDRKFYPELYQKEKREGVTLQ